MEVKRASPSGGAIRPAADAGALARAYRGAADAISVLTDAPYFGGSLDDLRAVRREFHGPILAKDFVVDPRQVAEARLHGADAVLAILAVLDDEEAAAMMAEARRLGMDVLVEAHDEEEVRRAVAARRRHHRHQQSRPRHAEGRSRHDRAAGRPGSGGPSGRRRIRDSEPRRRRAARRLMPTPSWSAPR